MKRLSAQHTIGELARAVGVGVSTVRYYERAGLLPQPDRTASSYRLYRDEAVARLRFIRRAQQLGFTLEEIKGLLELRVSRHTTCADVQSRANRYGGFFGNQLLRYDHPTTRGVHPHNYRASIESGPF